MTLNTVKHSKPVSPYTPDFGLSPPYLAGRDDVLARIKRGLSTGPRSTWFVHGISGDRGVGKTSLLNAIEAYAKSLGWPVVRLQVVSGESQLGTLVSDLAREASSKWSKVTSQLDRVDIEMTFGINLGPVKAGAKVTPRTSVAKPASIVLRDALQVVGGHARDHERGVLITVDEAHSWDKPEEVGALASALQLVVKRGQLPVAVYFAGLLHLSTVFEGAGTFLERMGIEELHVLTAEATRLALVQPAAALGVNIEDDALDLLVDGTKGYPYLVQLAGDFAWEAMHTMTIDSFAAAKGLKDAALEAERLYQDRWGKLTNLERAYVQAVAQLGPNPNTSDVARSLSRTPAQAATPRESLINKHRLLRATQHGNIDFALPGFSDWVSTQPPVKVSKVKGASKLPYG